MDRAPDRLPTTTTGEPVATVPSGPLPSTIDSSRDIAAGADAEAEEADRNGAQGVRFQVPDPSSDEEEEEEGAEDEEEEEEEDSDHGMDVDETELHPASVRV
jgi:hypothetical protein